MTLQAFSLQITLRVATLLALLIAISWAIAAPVPLSLIGILILLAAFVLVSLVRLIQRTNRELERFLVGLRFGDFQQTYRISHLGPSFQALEDALRMTVDKFRALRARQELEALHYRAIVEHVPVPLLMLQEDGKIEALNHATRRTFNVAELPGSEDLGRFGTAFQRDVLQIHPGESVLTTIALDGAEEQFILTARELTSGGRRCKLLALQNIQSEVDATELATWQNLLRVTSHEILNSLTPVSSSAQAAKSLADHLMVQDIDDAAVREDLKDIQDSLATVLRRSEGLTRFIRSYRQLSRMPRPTRRKVRMKDYLDRLESLLHPELARKGVELICQCRPPSLSVLADEDMLDQALINLVRNACDAVMEVSAPKISIQAFLDAKHRTIIEVQDNGPGVPENKVQDLFVPFYTTKKTGSGIGLALARQVTLNHGGSITYLPGEHGGAIFRMMF